MENESSNNSLRVIPNHAESEEAVLSAMLIDQEGLYAGLESLEGDDFYKRSNKLIFLAMKNLAVDNKTIDAITVNDYLTNKNELELIGGVQYLIAISNAVHTSANIRAHIKIVKEKSLLRSIIKIAENAMDMAYTSQENSGYIIHDVEKRLEHLNSLDKDTHFSKLSEVVPEVIDRMETIAMSDSHISGIPTGFADLDRYMAGLHNGALVLIAARPAMGKTAFALNIAEYISINTDKKVAFFSLEMSKEELVSRLVSSIAKIDASNARTGKMTDDDWLSIVNSMQDITKANMYINDDASATISEMKQKCRKLKKEVGLDVVFIDYLQLMNGDSRNDNRQQVISEISRELKLLAKELDIPVIALSQLSRASELRKDHRPILSDLRESGAIEQDADVVAFLYRDEYYNPETEEPGVSEVIIAKQRAGSVGTIKLGWLANLTKFVNLELNRDDEI